MGRTKGTLNKSKEKVTSLDSLSEHLQPIPTFKAWYDLGYEGGIAVFVSFGEHGEKIISVPRLGVSTCVCHDNDVMEMLLKSKDMSHRIHEAEKFASMILRDIQLCRYK